MPFAIQTSFDGSMAIPVGAFGEPPVGLEKALPLYSLTVLLPEFATQTLLLVSIAIPLGALRPPENGLPLAATPVGPSSLRLLPP